VDEAFPILIFVLFALIAGVAVYFGHKAAQKRREELWTLANELGFAFDPGKGPPDSPHSLFGEFQRGHSRGVLNTMRGDLDVFSRPCQTILGDFEYKVTSGSGKNRRTTTYRFSYILLRIPWAVPGLSLRRENILDKIAGAIGFDDIDFESEEFSRRFHVKCPDKKFAYDVVHPRMMEFLMASDAPALEFSGAWCLVTDGGSRWQPAAFRSQIEFVRGFFSRWPEHLVTDLETRRENGGMRLA
jgi:hypothetical protein